MKPHNYTTYAAIDLDAIAGNVRRITSHIGPQVQMFAVVKANAYGHGATPVARAALGSGATRLAVARVVEGIALRRAGITAPILVMGYFAEGEIAGIVAHDLTATITTSSLARALSDWAVSHGRQVKVHIKVDTGMGRFGLLPEEVVPFVDQMARLDGLELEGIYTHFAVADLADSSYTERQFLTFLGVLTSLDASGFSFRLRHVANSAATLALPHMHLDAVRVGIALYGLRPSDEVEPPVTLRPALSLKSCVARLRTLPTGSSIGYGRTYITSRPTPVALIPVGYGDGYRRALSNKGYVLIRGQRVPVIGRVSMDQLSVDVTGIEGVEEGDAVTLIGEQGSARISAEEVAALAGTINYEVTTGLLSRVPRIYLQGGKVVEITSPDR